MYTSEITPEMHARHEHDCGYYLCEADSPTPPPVVRTVPDSSDVTVAVTRHFSHRCPHVAETDHGHITITWQVQGQTYELHSLGKYLRGFRDAELSHEEVTDRIRHDLSVADGIDLLSVETHWETAGMEVRCSTSPTRADQL